MSLGRNPIRYDKELRDRALAEGKFLCTLQVCHDNGKPYVTVQGPYTAEERREIIDLIVRQAERRNGGTLPESPAPPDDGLREYVVYRSVESASGSQGFSVRAADEEDAKARVMRGEGDIKYHDVEVTCLGEPDSVEEA